MNFTELNNIPGPILLIDFEKAFDSLSWQFIKNALKFLNFGNSLVRWVDSFYNNITSAVSHNGHFSSFPLAVAVVRENHYHPTCLSYVQFLSTMIKNDKKYEVLL